MTTEQRNELKANIETVAAEMNITPLEAISQMQAGAAIINDEAALEALIDVKWDYIPQEYKA